MSGYKLVKPYCEGDWFWLIFPPGHLWAVDFIALQHTQLKTLRVQDFSKPYLRFTSIVHRLPFYITIPKRSLYRQFLRWVI